MSRILSFALISLLSCHLISCQEDDKNDELPREAFDRKMVLQDLYDAVILPDHLIMLEATLSLEESILDFESEPSSESLQAVKEKWNDTAVSWKYCALYNLGDIEDSFIHLKIHVWPAQQDFIENFIEIEEEITPEFISGIGSSSKGLSALEYLFFFSDEPSTLANFTSSSNGESRMNYAKALSKDLNTNINELIALWKTGGYESEFVENPNFSFGDSYAILVNQMIATLEVMEVRKMTKAMGLEAMGIVNPDLTEAPYSMFSKTLLLGDLMAVQKAFLSGLGGENLGIDDYLNHLNFDEDVPLSVRITEAFDRSKNAFENIPNEFSTEASLQSPEALQALNELKSLIVLIGTELPSRLGITITPNTSDGD